MPAKGTQQVEIDGRPVYLPKEDARLEHLLRRGCELQRQIKEIEAQIGPIKAELIQIATGRPGTGQAVQLEAHSGERASVSWAKRTTIDPERAEELLNALGPKTFAQVISKTVNYGVARGYDSFMKLTQVPELERAKKQIASALRVKVSRPGCKIYPASAAEKKVA